MGPVCDGKGTAHDGEVSMGAGLTSVRFATAKEA